MNITNTHQEKRPNRIGPNNPMYGRTHSMQSREKMSQAAKLRNQQYRDALRNQHHVSMEEFLSNNPSVKEYIKVLVKHQINELVKAKEHIENKKSKAIKYES